MSDPSDSPDKPPAPFARLEHQRDPNEAYARSEIGQDARMDLPGRRLGRGLAVLLILAVVLVAAFVLQ